MFFSSKKEIKRLFSFRNQSFFHTCSIFLSIILLLCAVIFHAAIIQAHAVFAQASSISESVIRFRVIANSDTDDDQQLKLELKTRMCQVLEPYLRDCNSLEEASGWICDHLDLIQTQADEILQELTAADISVSGDSTFGKVSDPSPVSCKVTMEMSYFPTRTYGNLTFPPGNYQALVISIGEGKGENWWCVLYPSLCFTDESTASFSEEAEEKLRQALSQGDYQALQQGVSFRFRIAEFMESLYKKLRSDPAD